MQQQGVLLIANQLRIGNDEEVSFLKKQYNEIKLISPRSVLSAYLDRMDLKKQDQKPMLSFRNGLS